MFRKMLQITFSSIPVQKKQSQNRSAKNVVFFLFCILVEKPTGAAVLPPAPLATLLLLSSFRFESRYTYGKLDDDLANLAVAKSLMQTTHKLKRETGTHTQKLKSYSKFF